MTKIHQDRGHRREMQHNVIQQIGLTEMTKPVLNQDQMSGRGYREEFRESLNDRKHHRFDVAHRL